MTPIFLDAASPPGGGVDPSNVVSLLSAVAAAFAIGITSLRKRKDVSIEELEKRARALDDQIEELTLDRDQARAEAVMNGRCLFTTRQVLAANGLPDPTVSNNQQERQPPP